MGRRILIYGVVAGLIVGVPMVSMMMLSDAQQLIEGGMLLGYTVMLIALSTIFLGIKRQRDIDGGGVIRFWPAFGLGVGISAVAAVCYAIAWEASLAVSGADFMAAYSQSVIEQQRAAGASAAELAKLRADMNAMAVNYANPLFRMPMTMVEILPVGILVSLVSAGLLRNPRFLPARPPQPVTSI